MRKVAVLLCFFLLLSGCRQVGAAELGTRLIIEAIGIDEDEAGYKITVLALNTMQSGSANSMETPDGISKVFSASGETVASAFSQIDLISGQIPLYSQARVIILGRQIAEDDPMKALNFFVREYTTRDDILLAVSDGTAKQIISADMGQNLLASKVLQGMLQSGEDNGLTLAVPLYRFISKMVNETDAAFLPVLKTEKNDKQEDEIHVTGTALFAINNHSATLDKEQTQGLLWADDLIESGLLEVSLNGNKVSLAVKDSKTKIRLTDTKKPAFSIDITLSCDVIEFNQSDKAEIDTDMVEKLIKAAEEKVKKDVESFLQAAMRDNGCDCLSFGRHLKKAAPALYENAIKDFPAFLKELSVSVNTDAKLLRTGRETLPTK